MIKIVWRNVIDDELGVIDWIVEFAPYLGCGFAAGFAFGIVINLWCLSTALP